VARASVSGNKGIEKSRKEGLLSQSPCKTDALFAPQLSKQHGAAADAAGSAVDCVCTLLASSWLNEGGPRC